MKTPTMVLLIAVFWLNLQFSSLLTLDGYQDTRIFQLGEPFSLAEMLDASESPIVTESMESIQKIFEAAEAESARKKMENSFQKMGRSGIASLDMHWPNGVVYYEIDRSFDNAERRLIRQAMAHISNHSCVRFEARNGQDAYVQIWPGTGGCYATLGYRSKMREIGLEMPTCNSSYVVLHELLHSIGFMHEMSRPDRDDYVTIHWDNMQPGQDIAFNYYRDNNVGDIPSKVCTTGAEKKEDLNNCTSQYFTTTCGLDYEYESIMHYESRAFAIDPSKPVISAKRPAPREFGSEQLTQLDIEKLRCLYQCDENDHSYCGGYFHKSNGEFKSDGSNGCDWLLKAPAEKRIILDFDRFPSHLTCNEASIEVYEGRSENGFHFGTYCSNNISDLIYTDSKHLFLKLRMVAGSLRKGLTFGTWKSEAVECCNEVVVDWPGKDLDWHFIKIEGNLHKGLPVYKAKDSEMYLSIFSQGFWIINQDYLDENETHAFRNNFEGLCPHLNSSWGYYQESVGGELKWNEDLDATVRCYDCQKYPSSPECETCSDSVKITSEDPSRLGAYAQLLGEYNINHNIPTFNDRKVYRQKGTNYCLYFNCDSWNVMECSHLQTQTKPDCGRYIGSSDVNVKTCATFPGLTWSKDIQVVQMTDEIKSGSIKSENYPENYPTDKDKTWTLEVPLGSTIRLTFEDFELEGRSSSSKNCFDFVMVMDSDGTTEFGMFCEKKIPSPIVSTGNKLTVVFHSDTTVTRKGFKAIWNEQK